jgi:4-hydroxy-3-polyprenylbenzoate decarboxylase
MHLTISESAREVLKHELGINLDLNGFRVRDLSPALQSNDSIIYHHYKDFMTPIASGSFLTRGMVVCPCSVSTLSGIATASSANLIQRAADVHLKERRPLILVTRETPLSLIQIQNMERVCAAGATLMPASPGFYHENVTVDGLVDFIVSRILDHLGVEHQLMQRWKG